MIRMEPRKQSGCEGNIIDRTKLLRNLRGEAEGLEASVNGEYRRMLLNAADLLEMDANLLAARGQQAAEMRGEIIGLRAQLDAVNKSIRRGELGVCRGKHV